MKVIRIELDGENCYINVTDSPQPIEKPDIAQAIMSMILCYITHSLQTKTFDYPAEAPPT